MDEEQNRTKSVEELIDELQALETILRKLDTTNMPDRTKGYVQGVLMGLSMAVKPPLPAGVEFLRMIVTAYERKYGLDPEHDTKSSERIKQARAHLEERMKQPDWEDRLEAIEKYSKWPDGTVR